MFTVGHSRPISAGVYLPAERLTSREIMEQFGAVNRFDVSPDWLERITGIRERRVTPAGVLPSDMAVVAAKEAMDRGGVLPSDIDSIIYTGVVRDYLEPATAHLIQMKLGATNATAFDLSNACLGFMNGVHLMDALIATGQVKRGLVVTGEQGKLFTQQAIETLKKTDEKETLVRLAAGLTLGDAGGALLMGPKTDPESGFMGFIVKSFGQFSNLCVAGELLGPRPVVTDMPTMISEGIKLIAGAYRELMENHLKWGTDELTLYILHQVGGSTFKYHHRHMGIPLEIMHRSVAELGNLITATIPVNLHGAMAERRVQSGQKVYLSGAGSGISVSQAGLIWDAA